MSYLIGAVLALVFGIAVELVRRCLRSAGWNTLDDVLTALLIVVAAIYIGMRI